MKKFIATLSIIVFTGCLLLSCDSEMTYDDGFDAGYDQGYWDASIEFDGDYSRGYEDGYSEGYWIGSSDHGYNSHEILEAAYDYAREKTGWSVYEAWNSILIYHAGTDPDGFAIPTKEEYLQCVNTLVLFCEYLEGELP